MTTDITELTQESARESGSILIIVAARMARREFFTPLHALCEAGKRVVSTRALRDAVERAEERMVSQVPKIVDGHDRLTKKLKEAESRNAELVEALEKAQQRIAELESRTVQLPKPKDSDPGWKIDPEFISKVQNAIEYDDQCECWEGTPSMEVVEAVLLAAAGIKMEVE
ncbi:TPA: hypothetical protein ACYSGY_004872 [Klebsiella pneumoniae]